MKAARRELFAHYLTPRPWSYEHHLGDADQPVITQFERWWDKYRVSLHEIDLHVKESEVVMWGYLKELGYE